jgi:hypothetical protein
MWGALSFLIISRSKFWEQKFLNYRERVLDLWKCCLWNHNADMISAQGDFFPQLKLPRNWGSCSCGHTQPYVPFLWWPVPPVRPFRDQNTSPACPRHTKKGKGLRSPECTTPGYCVQVELTKVWVSVWLTCTQSCGLVLVPAPHTPTFLTSDEQDPGHLLNKGIERVHIKGKAGF